MPAFIDSQIYLTIALSLGFLGNKLGSGLVSSKYSMIGKLSARVRLSIIKAGTCLNGLSF